MQDKLCGDWSSGVALINLLDSHYDAVIDKLPVLESVNLHPYMLRILAASLYTVFYICFWWIHLWIC
jgi:hypothetical protein